MNLTSTLAVVVGSILALCLAGYLILAIAQNYRDGLILRQLLSRRVGNLRLQRMLRRVGIDLRDYLHQQPIAEIEAQIRNCKACKSTVACELQLVGEGVLTPEQVGFCKNHKSFSELVKTSQS